MPFVESKFYIHSPTSAFLAIMREFHLNIKEAQKSIDKGRLIDSQNVTINKSQKIQGEFVFKHFVGDDLGLSPMYENEYFAIFDKPHNLLTHPKGIYTHQSLNDSIKYLYGKDANPTHRLDSATSGLVLVAKNKAVEREIKDMFALHKIQKIYLARVVGKIESCMIKLRILNKKDSENLHVKSIVDKNGKESITEIRILFYDKVSNQSVAKLIAHTGRTHQLRIHLSHIGHKILGDGVYGVSEDVADKYLTNKLSHSDKMLILGSANLALNAYYMGFTYHGIKYDFTSQIGLSQIKECK